MRLSVFALFALALVFGFASSPGAVAAEYTVTQKGKKFSPGTLDIKIGDTVKFVNDDKRRHNVYSRTEGHEFNVRKQKPGEANSRKFDKAGKIAVKCAIHPKMRLTINVR